MQLEYPVTGRDIDDIGVLAGSPPEVSVPAAQQLVAAVDADAIDDDTDIGYALRVAADIYTQVDDLETAERLAARAVEADDEYDCLTYLHSRVVHGVLLVRLGRENEALEMLEKTVVPELALAQFEGQELGELLIEAGRADLAVRLLTPPAKEATHILRDEDPDSLEYEMAELAAPRLLTARRNARAVLALPYDTYDEMADDLEQSRAEDIAEENRRKLTIIYWPDPDLDRFASSWPDLAKQYGVDTDDHRTHVEGSLSVEADRGRQYLAVHRASVDELLAFAGEEPVDLALLQRFADDVAARDVGTSWPPERNAPCWCGSGVKYKKCCRPRPGRTV